MSLTPEDIEAVKAAFAEAVREAKGSDSPWLDTEQAAAYIGSTYETLKSWRSQGIGPPCHRRGRLVRYHRDELDEWMGRRPTP